MISCSETSSVGQAARRDERDVAVNRVVGEAFRNEVASHAGRSFETWENPCPVFYADVPRRPMRVSFGKAPLR